MNKLPTLYKKTSTGAIQFWSIRTELQSDNTYWIITDYGQKDTPNPQSTHEVVSSGKNLGKSNETTIEEQANSDAKSQWEKKKKKGYVENIQDANIGKLDSLIKGGIEPMLAHDYNKQKKKIIYPCFGQPKLDGHRCVAIIKNNKCELWTRTRKLITSVPHINKELSILTDCVLDGELYNHKYKENFEYISHIVRQEIPDPEHTNVEYHVYDTISNDQFIQRYKTIKKLISGFNYTKLVETIVVTNQSNIQIHYDKFLDLGYEGMMLRNPNSLYVNKRSYDLQKVKEFQDAEWPIIGIKEGKGKLAGHVGSFILEMDNGQTFEAKMKGDTIVLKEFFDNQELWKNKYLTVQFQGFTAKNAVPRFPVGLRIRNDI